MIAARISATPSPSLDSIKISTFCNSKKMLSALGAFCRLFKSASVFDQVLSSQSSEVSVSRGVNCFNASCAKATCD